MPCQTKREQTQKSSGYAFRYNSRRKKTDKKARNPLSPYRRFHSSCHNLRYEIIQKGDCVSSLCACLCSVCIRKKGKACIQFFAKNQMRVELTQQSIQFNLFPALSLLSGYTEAWCGVELRLELAFSIATRTAP